MTNEKLDALVAQLRKFEDWAKAEYSGRPVHSYSGEAADAIEDLRAKVKMLEDELDIQLIGDDIIYAEEWYPVYELDWPRSSASSVSTSYEGWLDLMLLSNLRLDCDNRIAEALGRIDNYRGQDEADRKTGLVAPRDYY